MKYYPNGKDGPFRKYLVIGHRFGKLGRGGYHVSKRFCEENNEYCDFLVDFKARNLEELNKKYRKLIFRTQVPRCYVIPVNFVRLRKINHVFYLRERYMPHIYNHCTNGFYYYHKVSKFSNYVPMITDFPKVPLPSKLCLGFYHRPWLTPDSFDCFLQILDDFPYKVDVCIMGEPCPKVEHHNKVLHYKHTNDNVQFFSEISHYYYPTSKRFVDPFPHSVLEAVQSHRTVVFPTIERDFKDGIDDLKDVIEWDEKFNELGLLYNKDQPLTAANFKKFYEKVFDNDWNYCLDRQKYKTFDKWVEHEIL